MVVIDCIHFPEFPFRAGDFFNTTYLIRFSDFILWLKFKRFLRLTHRTGEKRSAFSPTGHDVGLIPLLCGGHPRNAPYRELIVYQHLNNCPRICFVIITYLISSRLIRHHDEGTIPLRMLFMEGPHSNVVALRRGITSVRFIFNRTGKIEVWVPVPTDVFLWLGPKGKQNPLTIELS